MNQWLIGLFVLYLPYANGQIRTISQLRLQLKQARYDTVRLRLYTDLASAYSRLPNLDSTHYMVSRGLVLARRYKRPVAEGTLLLHLGYCYKRLGQYARAQTIYLSALRQQTNRKSTVLHRLLFYRLACIYNDRGMFSNSIEASFSLLKAAQLHKDTLQMCRAYQLLAISHMNTHNVKLAFSYAQVYYKLINQFVATHPEEQQELIFSEALIADLHETRGEYTQAYPYLKKTFDYFVTQHDEGQIAEAGWHVAKNLVQQKRGLDGLNFLDKSIRQNLFSTNVSEISEVYALAHQQLGHGAKALFFARKAYRLSLTNSPAKQVQSTLRTLIHLEESHKQYPSALAHLHQLTAIDDSLFTIQKSQAIAEVEAKYQLTQHEQTIELLRKDAALRKISLDQNQNELRIQHQRQLLLRVLIVVLVLGLVGLFIIFRRERTLGRYLAIQKAEIEDKANQLEELNSLKNKLFSIIGHDLRSPIASLKTQLMGVQDGYISPSSFTERTGKLTQMVDNVYLAMDNLLHWSMLQREGLLPQTSQLDLAELTESVLRLYHTEMQQKHLRLHTQLGPTPVQADELQLQIVVRNLLHNAIKFTPPGGSLTLSSGEQSGQGWLRIADTGVGMVLTPAGGRSAQVVPGRGTAGEKGTGLGLALCREFVRLNGGALTIDSTPGQGTTVSILFGY